MHESNKSSIIRHLFHRNYVSIERLLLLLRNRRLCDLPRAISDVIFPQRNSIESEDNKKPIMIFNKVYCSACVFFLANKKAKNETFSHMRFHISLTSYYYFYVFSGKACFMFKKTFSSCVYLCLHPEWQKTFDGSLVILL